MTGSRWRPLLDFWAASALIIVTWCGLCQGCWWASDFFGGFIGGCFFVVGLLLAGGVALLFPTVAYLSVPFWPVRKAAEPAICAKNAQRPAHDANNKLRPVPVREDSQRLMEGQTR